MLQSSIDVIFRCSTVRRLSLCVDSLDAAVLDEITRGMASGNLTSLHVAVRDTDVERTHLLSEASREWLLASGTLEYLSLDGSCWDGAQRVIWHRSTMYLGAIVQAVATRAQQGRPCRCVRVWGWNANNQKVMALAKEMGVEGVINVNDMDWLIVPRHTLLIDVTNAAACAHCHVFF